MTEFKKTLVNLPKVRLIFPSLFEKTPIDGNFVKTEEDRKYSATFLLSKVDHASVIEEINLRSEMIMKNLKLKKLKHPIMKCCDEELEEIDESDEDGKAKKRAMMYKANHFQLQAKSSILPTLRKIKATATSKAVDYDIEVDENPFYAGCYVNAIIELAPYDNTFGKGISKYLKYVIFNSHGEKLGSPSKFDGDDQFEDDEIEDADDCFKDEAPF